MSKNRLGRDIDEPVDGVDDFWMDGLAERIRRRQEKNSPRMRTKHLDDYSPVQKARRPQGDDHYEG